MIRSLYTVNRNMNILQKKQENTSANFANVNTPGYKFQKIVQSTQETNTMINYAGGAQNSSRQALGSFVFGNQIDEVYKDFNQGILNETGITTDFALIGQGFFTIEMDNGEIGYTRNGNFRVNEDNQLVTMEGYNVLGADGGAVNILDENVNLLVTDFNDYTDLDSLGDTIFIGAGGFTIEGEVRQAFLESSNVSVVDEIVKMIEISREFESNQKLLHAADETLNKAVNEIGRV